MKSVLVHDWLTNAVGGGENVLEAIHRLIPSPIYTLVSNPKKLINSYFEDLDIHTSFIQKLPLAETKYRHYLPFFPKAIERFDLRPFDLIISSSHCVAKGVITHPNQLHICYCHTPMRYAWDLMEHYLKEAHLDRGLKGLISRKILMSLQNWDHRVSNRVNHFIANSQYIAARIEKAYGRSSQVIYPPVNTTHFQMKEKKEDYYITASRLVQNKRIDLIIDAFSQMPDKKIIIIGEGPEKKKIQAKASPNIEFLGTQTRDLLKYYLQNAKGFVFAAIEDFGIAPVEAMATGTPVIAYGEGGVLETVIPGETGLFFKEQTAQSLIQAVKEFEKMSFDPKKCRERAEHFSLEKFRRGFQMFVIDKYIDFKNRG
jgi:glycosyltransferase involved in cell wall biosynthesis